MGTVIWLTGSWTLTSLQSSLKNKRVEIIKCLRVVNFLSFVIDGKYIIWKKYIGRKMHYMNNYIYFIGWKTIRRKGDNFLIFFFTYNLTIFVDVKLCILDTVKLTWAEQDAECCGITFDFIWIIRPFLRSLFSYYIRSQLTST